MINDYREIIDRYSEILIGSEIMSDSGDLKSMNDLLDEFQPFVDKLKEVEMIETPYYNLFRILGIKHLEAIVHTPFLVDLLNPEGTHSQGTFFLDIFLIDILELDTENFISYDSNYLYVFQEFGFTKGRIDILILYRHPKKEKQFAIIIENKIYAVDQKNQLKRYHDFLLLELELRPEQIRILYLTPKGHEPSDYSIESELKVELYQNGVLRTISYAKEIRQWLNKCNSDFKLRSEKVKQSINQYLEIINELTNE